MTGTVQWSGRPPAPSDKATVAGGITPSMVRVVAESDGVCVRPLVRHVLDRQSGERVTVALPCGSTRESRCPACAQRAKWLRMQQCREGWHLSDEPELSGADVDDDAGGGDLGDEPDAGTEAGAGDTGPAGARRSRSTRRVEGFPDLPAVPMACGTIGRTYVDPVTGKTFRPSMFLTLTLPSYGRVRDGVPVNPETYDYRRAALDALLFPRLLDRFWQNLRRCAACKVQYFSAVEAQRRLAPHLHAAVRGAIPRATLRAVVRATYYAAWCPSVDRVVYADDRVPVWHSASGQYVDPDTGEVLPTWEASRRRARRTGACGVLRHPTGHQRHPRRLRAVSRGGALLVPHQTRPRITDQVRIVEHRGNPVRHLHASDAPSGRYGSDVSQVQSSTLTGAFARHHPPTPHPTGGSGLRDCGLLPTATAVISEATPNKPPWRDLEVGLSATPAGPASDANCWIGPLTPRRADLQADGPGSGLGNRTGSRILRSRWREPISAVGQEFRAFSTPSSPSDSALESFS
ncbi:MAG: replication initiator [Dermatophilaceae bacterium]